MPGKEAMLRGTAGYPPSIGWAVRDAAAELAAATTSPRLDAELLLADTLGVERSHLFAHPERRLEPAQAAAFHERVRRRIAGEPVAYLLGRSEFYGLPLLVTPAVLIPRPETEHVVEQALARLPHGGRLLDPGTGSGAIALAVAAERPDARVEALERNPQALAVAAANRRRLGLTEQVTLHAGDWAEGLPAGPFQVIAANPPYVATTAPQWQDGSLAYEPAEALAAGSDGLDAIRALLPPAFAALAAGGSLVLEHGAEQGAAVRGLLAAAGLEAVTTAHDLAGLERVTCGRRPA